MAISFIPVRDQLNIMQTSRNVARNKGAVLKRLSTGKKIFNSSDGIEEFSRIQRMKKDLYEYEKTTKNIKLAKSRLETALSVVDLVYEQYTKLAIKINDIPTDLPTTWSTNPTDEEKFNKTLRQQLQSDINVSIDAIKNLLDTKLDGKNVVNADGTKIELIISERDGVKLDVSLAKLKIDDSTAANNTTGITLNNFKELVYKADAVGATTGELGNYNAFSGTAASSMKKSTLYEALMTAARTAYNNYNILLSNIETLSNMEDLSYVKKANTEAAISAMEDVDIQEEMVNLMQAQILEELSSEALKAIKDSARFVIRLVQN